MAQLSMNLRAAGERSVFPHSIKCLCSECVQRHSIEAARRRLDVKHRAARDRYNRSSK